MLCINQCEKPVTIGFCQANKNRNVIPVRVDTDQSSPSVSHWLAFSVSLLTETHFDDLKGRLCFFHYSNILVLDISVRPQTALYVSGDSACMWKSSTQHALKHLCWVISTSRNFPFYYYISDATMCKFIWLNYSLIEIKSKHIDQHGRHYSTLNIYCVVSYVFVYFAFEENTHATCCC